MWRQGGHAMRGQDFCNLNPMERLTIPSSFVSCFSVSVPLAITANAAGTPNAAASLTVNYKPRTLSMRVASYAAGGLLGATTLTSWTTSFIISSMQPFSTAGLCGTSTCAACWPAETPAWQPAKVCHP